MNGLREKTILIIGGTTGIGLSSALACLNEGASIIVVGRDPGHCSDAQKLLGVSGHVLEGDAVDPSTAEKAIRLALDKTGRLDGLYHVAGGSGRKYGDGPMHEITDEGWEKTLHWNLDSLMYANRAVLNHFMSEKKGGVILNMASVLAYSPSSKYFATHAYAAAKAAVIGMSRSMAAYYAPFNIRVNVIAPALVETPMSARAAGNPDILRFAASKQPLDGGRIAMPADLDGAAVFLLSEQSAFITGQVLGVDGGWSLSEGQYA